MTVLLLLALATCLSAVVPVVRGAIMARSLCATAGVCTYNTFCDAFQFAEAYVGTGSQVTLEMRGRVEFNSSCANNNETKNTANPIYVLDLSAHTATGQLIIKCVDPVGDPCEFYFGERVTFYIPPYLELFEMVDVRVTQNPLAIDLGEDVTGLGRLAAFNVRPARTKLTNVVFDGGNYFNGVFYTGSSQVTLENVEVKNIKFSGTHPLAGVAVSIEASRWATEWDPLNMGEPRVNVTNFMATNVDTKTQAGVLVTSNHDNNPVRGQVFLRNVTAVDISQSNDASLAAAFYSQYVQVWDVRDVSCTDVYAAKDGGCLRTTQTRRFYAENVKCEYLRSSNDGGCIHATSVRSTAGFGAPPELLPKLPDSLRTPLAETGMDSNIVLRNVQCERLKANEDGQCLYMRSNQRIHVQNLHCFNEFSDSTENGGCIYSVYNQFLRLRDVLVEDLEATRGVGLYSVCFKPLPETVVRDILVDDTTANLTEEIIQRELLPIDTNPNVTFDWRFDYDVLEPLYNRTIMADPIGRVDVKNLTIRNSTVSFGAVYNVNCGGVMDNVTIVDNTGKGNGAGSGFWLQLPRMAVLRIQNSEVSRNIANVGGGGLQTLINSGRLLVDNVLFEENASPKGGAADMSVLRSGDGSEPFVFVKFDNCVFRKNRSPAGAAILADGMNVYVAVNNSVFEYHESSEFGAVADMGGGSHLRMHNTRLIGNRASRGGAVRIDTVDMQDSTVAELQNIEAYDNTADSGGVLTCTGTSQVEISGGNFHNNAASVRGGVAYAEGECELVILNGTWHDNLANEGGAAVSVVDNVNLTMSGVHLSNHLAREGGAVHAAIKDDAMVSLRECAFDGNSAEDGGAVMITSNTYALRALMDTFSGKSNLTLLSVGFDVDSCSFTQNEARSGAALFVEDVARGQITSNTFRNNAATVAGAGVYVARVDANGEVDRVSGNSNSGNVAPYGGDFGTGVYSLGVSVERDEYKLGEHMHITIEALDALGQRLQGAHELLLLEFELLNAPAGLYLVAPSTAIADGSADVRDAVLATTKPLDSAYTVTILVSAGDDLQQRVLVSVNPCGGGDIHMSFRHALPALVETATTAGVPLDDLQVCVDDVTLTTTQVSVGIAVLVVCFLVLAVLMALAFWKRDTRVMHATSVPFLLLFLSCGMLALVSCVLFLVTPTTTLCNARRLLLLVSLAALFSALLVRSFRLFRVFRNKYLRSAVIHNSTLLKWVLAIVTVQLVLLAVSVGVAPLKVLDDARPQCEIDDDNDHKVAHDVIMGVIVTIDALFLLGGGYVNFQLRDVPSLFNDASSVGLAIVNAVITGALGLVVHSVADADEFATVLLVCWCVVGASCLVMLPKLKAAMGDELDVRISTTGSSIAGAGSTSGVDMGGLSNMSEDQQQRALRRMSKPKRRVVECLQELEQLDEEYTQLIENAGKVRGRYREHERRLGELQFELAYYERHGKNPSRRTQRPETLGRSTHDYDRDVRAESDASSVQSDSELRATGRHGSNAHVAMTHMQA
ncbi:MAG: hypothetical protein MHM6MM_003189 [Cercozoa sp. M6MM]